MPNSFRAPKWLRNGTLHTIWANFAPREDSAQLLHVTADQEIISTSDGDRLRLHWNGPAPGAAPVLVLLHGLTGCAGSSQVVGVADKALRAGFTTLRVDLRNALGDAPSTGVGHAGRSEDVRTVLAHVASRAAGQPIGLVGYSLGGNVLLKALGEAGNDVAAEIRGAVAISVPIDLDVASAAIDAPGNRVFRSYFVRRLKRLVASRVEQVPAYGDIDVSGASSIRELDGLLVSPLCGFASAEDYYARCSSLPLLPDIRVPTLLIQAQDDPFIPFQSFQSASISGNPKIQVLAPEHGGHAGFWAKRSGDPDRFWAEHRAVEFAAGHVGLA